MKLRTWVRPGGFDHRREHALNVVSWTWIVADGSWVYVLANGEVRLERASQGNTSLAKMLAADDLWEEI